MSFELSRLAGAVALGLALALAGCAGLPSDPGATGTPRPASIDRALEDRILALDPERVTERDVRETLALGPTPHIMLLHGGIYPVHLLMESFAEFLGQMGYPLDRIRDPVDKTLSRSPYESAERQAGLVAWYYERDGVRPMIVGHSQGGIQAVKVLHELAGSFGSPLRVFNPLTGEFEPRQTIVDPLTGKTVPIVGGTSVSYASVIGTGGWSLALPVHWIVFTRVRDIPDSIDEFTGYRIGVDLFAWDVPGLEGIKTFRANGKATVRNITLPPGISHVFAPGVADLAADPVQRQWIEAFDPARETRWEAPAGISDAAVWAADVWHSVKRHWVREAQRLIKARRAAAKP
jgi:hypothetical protein